MAVTNSDHAIEQVEYLMATSASLVSDDGKDQSVVQSMMELGWSFPITNDFKSYWVVERTKRHFLFILMLEQAHKFRYKQIHLQQRFDHYAKMIEKIDADFQMAIDDNPQMFPASTVGWAGTFLPAGFVYDQIGRDVTYEY